MKKPTHAAKFGAYIETSMNEYEHFVGHLVDSHSDKDDLGDNWVQYEIPV
eukprot:CAMPEP_0116883292 /NCGR_PEP_ID=MMETSP0463-20121206/15796_1 /TAXON_ID=181622 /ORGANISM="Strombidinopsis sp, Strain SopsisLIS2011" /LENGTH=49 /DNA_ID=CAMNT_0004537875 /DNA_START=387 /DNA_END=536 /DNA_ORIENTATION=+